MSVVIFNNMFETLHVVQHLRRAKYIDQSRHGDCHDWHVDGYDKLKPYGFPVHGCIL